MDIAFPFIAVLEFIESSMFEKHKGNLGYQFGNRMFFTWTSSHIC